MIRCEAISSNYTSCLRTFPADCSYRNADLLSVQKFKSPQLIRGYDGYSRRRLWRETSIPWRVGRHGNPRTPHRVDAKFSGEYAPAAQGARSAVNKHNRTDETAERLDAAKPPPRCTTSRWPVRRHTRLRSDRWRSCSWWRPALAVPAIRAAACGRPYPF